jgi:hypothetical protein
MKTRIMTTYKNGGKGKKKGNKKWHKAQTKKVHLTHKGSSMKTMVKSHVQGKRGRKR